MHCHILAFWHCLGWRSWPSSPNRRVTSAPENDSNPETTFVARAVLFIRLSVRVCFPKERNDKSACVHPRCVIMSGRLERRWSMWRRRVQGTKSVRWKEEMRSGEEERSWCVCSCRRTMALMKCSLAGLSIKLLSPCLSVTLSVLHLFFCPLFCSFRLLSSPKQSPLLFRPQPALCGREARPLLCGQSRLSNYCSVIVSKWILDRS